MSRGASSSIQLRNRRYPATFREGTAVTGNSPLQHLVAVNSTTPQRVAVTLVHVVPCTLGTLSQHNRLDQHLVYTCGARPVSGSSIVLQTSNSIQHTVCASTHTHSTHQTHRPTLTTQIPIPEDSDQQTSVKLSKTA